MSFQFQLLPGNLGTRCPHCGSDRLVTSVRRLRRSFADSPTPLLLHVVAELRHEYGTEAPLYLCAGCKCVTADSSPHAH